MRLPLQRCFCVSDRMESGCWGWIWGGWGLDMTKMNQVGRTSPCSLVLTQAGHVVIAIQGEDKCYPTSFPILGACRHSLPLPGPFACLPGGRRGNSFSQVMLGLWVELPEQIDFQPTLPT